MSRWSVVWRLLTRRFGHSPENDMAEAQRRRLEEEYELEHARSRRPAVEHAAEQLQRARAERDFTALVEETFMPRRHP